MQYHEYMKDSTDREPQYYQQQKRSWCSRHCIDDKSTQCCIHDDASYYDDALPCYSKKNMFYILSSILCAGATCIGVIGTLLVGGYFFYWLYSGGFDKNSDTNNNSIDASLRVQMVVQYLLSGIITIVCWFISTALLTGIVLGVLFPCSLCMEITPVRKWFRSKNHRRSHSQHAAMILFIVLVIVSVPYSMFAIPASALMLPIGGISFPHYHQESCVQYTGHFMNVRCFMEGLSIHFIFFMGISIVDMFVWCFCYTRESSSWCCFPTSYTNHKDPTIKDGHVNEDPDDLERAPLLSRA